MPMSWANTRVTLLPVETVPLALFVSPKCDCRHFQKMNAPTAGVRPHPCRTHKLLSEFADSLSKSLRSHAAPPSVPVQADSLLEPRRSSLPPHSLPVPLWSDVVDTVGRCLLAPYTNHCKHFVPSVMALKMLILHSFHATYSSLIFPSNILVYQLIQPQLHP